MARPGLENFPASSRLVCCPGHLGCVGATRVLSFHRIAVQAPIPRHESALAGLWSPTTVTNVQMLLVLRRGVASSKYRSAGRRSVGAYGLEDQERLFLCAVCYRSVQPLHARQSPSQVFSSITPAQNMRTRGARGMAEILPRDTVLRCVSKYQYKVNNRSRPELRAPSQAWPRRLVPRCV